MQPTELTPRTSPLQPQILQQITTHLMSTSDPITTSDNFICNFRSSTTSDNLICAVQSCSHRGQPPMQLRILQTPPGISIGIFTSSPTSKALIATSNRVNCLRQPPLQPGSRGRLRQPNLQPRLLHPPSAAPREQRQQQCPARPPSIFGYDALVCLSFLHSFLPSFILSSCSCFFSL